MLSGRKWDNAIIGRRWAWKQPSFKESVTAHYFNGVVSFKMYGNSCI